MKKSELFIPKGALMVDINANGDTEIIGDMIVSGDLRPNSKNMKYTQIAKLKRDMFYGEIPKGNDFDPAIKDGLRIHMLAFIVNGEFIYIHPEFTKKYKRELSKRK